MKKKAMLVLMSVALAAGSFAGCGKKSGSEADTGKKDAAQEKDAAKTGQTEDNGTVKLRFWCDEDELALFQEMTDKFIEEHKSEASIEVEYEMVGAAVCKDTMLADVTNGADIFSMPDDQLLTMVAAGVLEKIENGDEIAAQNLEGAVEASSVNGSLYAYPVTADNGYFLYYDKKYFTEDDVKTMDGILKVCEQNNKKFIMDWTSGWYLYSFFGNTGLTVGMNEDGLTNYCDWNAEKGDIKGVDIAQALLRISKSSGFLNGTEFAKAAKDGTAIAAVSGVWDIAAMKEAYGNDYGACKLPTYTVAGRQVQMSSFKGYRQLGVNAYSKHKEWAAKLAEYLTNEENQNIRFERAGRGPSNKNAAASDAINKVPAIAAVLDQSQYASLQLIGPKYWKPVTDFGTTMAEGNPRNMPLQDLLDAMVSGITE